MGVGCAVLAAGSGVRFRLDGSKLLVPVRGKPLVQWAIDAASASSASRCSLIIGARADAILSNVDLRRCSAVVNPRWHEGIASSIACAVSAHRSDEALVLMLGDQPNVTASDIDLIIARHEAGSPRIVMLRSGETWGAPALFSRSNYAALRSLRGDSGAKRLAEAQRSMIDFVDATSSDPFADVDTPEDALTYRIAR